MAAITPAAKFQHTTDSLLGSWSWVWVVFILITGLWYWRVGRATIPGRFSSVPRLEFINAIPNPTEGLLNQIDAVPSAPASSPLKTSSTSSGFFPKVFVLGFFVLLYLVAYREWINQTTLFVLAAMGMTFFGTTIGFYDGQMAWKALWGKIDVFFLLVGMGVITIILTQGGFFDYWAKKITLFTRRDHWRIMVCFCLLTFTVSLFVNNLTAMLVLIPMILSLSRYMRFNPQIYLIGMVVASNLGGASTMIGDFPNMLIGAKAGVAFIEFLIYMLPICLFELFLLIVYLRAREQKGGSPPVLQNDVPPADEMEPFFQQIKRQLQAGLKNATAVRRTLWILGVVTIAFLFSDRIHVPPAFIALAGGFAALFLSGVPPARVLREVGIRDLLFFAALFVLVGAAEASGLLGWFGEIIFHLSFGNILVRCLLLMWVAGLLTAFLNAGPSTALFLPLVMGFHTPAPHHLYWWALSLGVLAGSSATTTGATAGMVASSMLAQFKPDPVNGLKAQPRAQLTFREYAQVGIPVALLFLAVSSVYLAVIYRFV
ncbi:MAG: hypothetical protein LHV69_08325 [Elusimicrobia bacterium]|nr:hypothetical protein [Candidatus Obscuribacterium magneticum]